MHFRIVSLIVVLVGILSRLIPHAPNIAAITSLMIFIGVWSPPNKWYPHTLEGLIQSYTMALPFFRNSLISDIAYTIILFGGYELIRSFSKKYLSQKLFQLLY